MWPRDWGSRCSAVKCDPPYHLTTSPASYCLMYFLNTRGPTSAP